jgi:protein TonB
MTPYENVIIGNSFEEIVFANRNKEYGAYQLRKKQKGYLIIAFLFALLFVASSVITPMIYNHYKGKPQPEPSGFGTTLIQVDSTLQIVAPEIPDIKLDRPVNVPPVVVDTIDENEPLFATMEELVDNTDNLTPPDVITTVVIHDDVIEVVERPFVKVEIEAKFRGEGLLSFNKWVAANIKYPQICVENGITGKVYVQFVVNKTGQVEDVKVLRGADPSLDQEAIRVIQSSPKWSAPLQGGKPVKQLFTLPVNFRLDDIQ